MLLCQACTQGRHSDAPAVSMLWAGGFCGHRYWMGAADVDRKGGREKMVLLNLMGALG